MNKEFIPYKQAVALKKLGFDEPCFGCYDEKTIFGLTVMSIKQYYTNSKEDTWNCAAPLYQQAFRWFREKYGLGHMINGIGYESFIMNIGGMLHIFNAFDFKTYEEAELACLNKLIEIVTNEQTRTTG